MTDNPFATMPAKRERRVAVPWSMDIRRALAGGKRLTAKEIAAALNATTRDIQQSVCTSVFQKARWLSREKPSAGEYVYFLTAPK